MSVTVQVRNLMKTLLSPVGYSCPSPGFPSPLRKNDSDSQALMAVFAWFSFSVAGVGIGRTIPVHDWTVRGDRAMCLSTCRGGGQSCETYRTRSAKGSLQKSPVLNRLISIN